MATFSALEILKLIADHMENHGAAEAEDIDAVLGFLRDVAHPCVENTKTSLLMPLLDGGIGLRERTRIAAVLENCSRVAGLLEEVERSHQNGRLPEFVTASRTYTTAFGNLLYEEDSFLPSLIGSVSTESKVLKLLADFDAMEAILADQARSAGAKLRRLESKYVSPHCI
jgi:hypothetical protein